MRLWRSGSVLKAFDGNEARLNSTYQAVSQVAGYDSTVVAVAAQQQTRMTDKARRLHIGFGLRCEGRCRVNFQKLFF